MHICRRLQNNLSGVCVLFILHYSQQQKDQRWRCHHMIVLILVRHGDYRHWEIAETPNLPKLVENKLGKRWNIEANVGATYSYTQVQFHRYGDIVPITAEEKWVATLCMVWGVVLFGYILGGLASMLTNSDAQRARYIHRLNTIRDHLVQSVFKYV